MDARGRQLAFPLVGQIDFEAAVLEFLKASFSTSWRKPVGHRKELSHHPERSGAGRWRKSLMTSLEPLDPIMIESGCTLMFPVK